jgi:hypothetical protein
VGPGRRLESAVVFLRSCSFSWASFRSLANLSRRGVTSGMKFSFSITDRRSWQTSAGVRNSRPKLRKAAEYPVDENFVVFITNRIAGNLFGQSV